MLFKQFIKFSIYITPCLLFCTVDIADNGGGSEVGNGIVAGKIYEDDGTPASNARVILRQKSFLKDTAEAYLIRNYIDSAETFTDDKGVYTFDSVDAGQYNIEAIMIDDGQYNNEVVIVDSHAVLLECEVFKGDSLVTVPGGILAPMKSIQGNVSLYGGPEAKRFIQVYGLDRVVATDSSGDFQISVPNGVFTLRLIVEKTEYPILDIPDVVPETDPVELKLLSKNPVSTNIITDSLIVRAILDSNGQQSVAVFSVAEKKLINSQMRIYEFHLQGTGYTILPGIFGGLNELNEVSISGTLMSSIPARIGELVKINDKLHLNNNKLTTLPEEIANLVNVNDVDLSYNKLANLPPAAKAWADTRDPDWEATQDPGNRK